MNKKIFISFSCFWFAGLISYFLFPNSVLFTKIQAVFQDKTVVRGLTISIRDEINPNSEIISLNKLDQQTVRVDYQADDDGAGIDYVQLWQRSLDSDWELKDVGSNTSGYFILYFLPDNIYQWQTIAVDKAGNKQTEDVKQLANEEFNDWDFSTLQIDTQPPSLAFSIPDFNPPTTLVDQFEIKGQGENKVNTYLSQQNSFLVFEYQLITQAVAERVQFQVLIDNQLIYVDGAGEENGWVGDSGWQQVTYPLKERLGEIEILFRLINNDQANYVPKLEIKNIGLVESKEEFNELKIYFIAHDLGSGVKEATLDDEISSDDMKNKEFKAEDFMGNTTFL